MARSALDPFEIAPKKSEIFTHRSTTMTDAVARLRRQKLMEHKDRPRTPTGRLQVRVGPEVEDLVARLAILLGCKRAEVVRLALEEFAEKIHPELLSPA